MHRWILSLTLLLFVGCSKKGKVTHIRGIAMTMPYHIQIGDPISNCQALKLKKVIDTTFFTIDQTLNHWNPNSELSRLNRSNTTESHPASLHLQKVLQLSYAIHTLSERRFDPTLGKAIKKWKSALLSKEIPIHQESPVGLEYIVLNDGCVEKNEAVELDFDGIAKGYAVDLLIADLQDAGIKNLYVNWGGEIAVSGSHPEKRPWQILMPCTGKVISIEACGVATSGNGMQHCEIDKHIYSHYVDHSSQMALPQLKQRTITVIAPNCALADGLATSGMLINDAETYREWKKNICQKNPGVQFFD